MTDSCCILDIGPTQDSRHNTGGCVETKQIGFALWALSNFETKRGRVHFLKSSYSSDDYMKFFSLFRPMKDLEKIYPEVHHLVGLDFDEANDIFCKTVEGLLTPPLTQAKTAITGGIMEQTEGNKIGIKTLQEYIKKNCIYVTPKNNSAVSPFFFDVPERRVSEYTVAAVKETIPHPVRTNFDAYKNNMWIVDLKYTPFVFNSKERVEDNKEFSTYLNPEWRFLNPSKGSMHPMLQEFFDHLVPNVVCRDYLFRWIHRSLRTPCPQHLFLIGRKGIGKGILVSNLLTSLHGRANTVIGKRNTLETPFNSSLESRTLMFLDEMHIASGNQKETLKLWCNFDVSVEAKGQDARDISRTASIVVAANYTTSIHIDLVTDRKFLVVDLGEKDLLEAKGQVWIDELLQAIALPKTQRDFYDFLDNFVDENPFEIYAGDTYYKMALDTLDRPLEYVWEKIRERKKPAYIISDLRKSYAKEQKKASAGTKWISPDALYDFFEVFLYKGKKVAKVDAAKGLLIPINDFEVNLEV